MDKPKKFTLEEVIKIFNDADSDSSLDSCDSGEDEARQTPFKLMSSDKTSCRPDSDSSDEDQDTEDETSDEFCAEWGCFQDEFNDIFEACDRGWLDRVKRLVKEDKSALKSMDKQKRTPLHYACGAKKTYIVKFLLEQGADVNAEDDSKGTPLHAAVDSTGTCNLKRREKRVKAIVKMLVDAGATQSSRKTPLYDYVCNYLESHRGLENIPQDMIKMLLAYGDEAKKELGKHVTRLAVKHGNLELLELCLQHGGDVNETNDDDKSSLLHAAIHSNSTNDSPDLPDERKCKTLKYLLDKGCTRINYKAATGTPLYVATINGYRKCVELLSSHGARMGVKHPLPSKASPPKSFTPERTPGAKSTKMLASVAPSSFQVPAQGFYSFKKLADETNKKKEVRVVTRLTSTKAFMEALEKKVQGVREKQREKQKEKQRMARAKAMATKRIPKLQANL